MKKRESPDFRSPEVGISETTPWSVTGYEPLSPRKPCSCTRYKFHDEFLNTVDYFFLLEYSHLTTSLSLSCLCLYS